MAFEFKGAHASVLLSLCLGCNVAGAIAQTPPVAGSASAPPDATAPIPPPPSDVGMPADAIGDTTAEACCTLVDGSPVELQIADALNTMTLKRGDRFRIRLHAPMKVAAGVLLPAGVEGVGEVVHVEPGRASGKAAELILAARHLDYNGRQIKLRGMKLSASGANRSGMVAGVSIAIGVFAAFIHGGNIEIPADTVVSAKIGETLRLPLLSAPTPSTDGTEDPQATGTDMEKPSSNEDSPSH